MVGSYLISQKSNVKKKTREWQKLKYKHQRDGKIKESAYRSFDKNW